jgi:MFS family permease
VLRRYREVLSQPHVARLMLTAMAARLPQGMTGLAVLLLLTPRFGYGKAGVATGLGVAVSGLSNIVLARAIDRFGARAVLLPASVLYLVGACLLAALADSRYAVQLGVCGVIGLASAPISSVSRGLWPELLGVDRAQLLYGLEATAQELVFIVGPAGVALVAGLANAKVALVLSGVLGLGGVIGFVTAPVFGHGVRTEGGPRQPGLWRSRVGAYAVVGVCLTVGFSMTEIATVAFVGGQHATTASGVVLAVWSAGSMAGGLVFGAGATSVTDRALSISVAIAGVGLVLPVVAPERVGLAVILFVSGAAIAPSLARLYTRMGTVAPAGATTEAFGWLSVGFQAGSALGAALGGIAVDEIGARWTFLLAGVGAFIAVIVVRGSRVAS